MHVFVYGTLTDPARAASVLEDFAYAGAATLAGLQRVEGQYSTLAPGGEVAGRLLRTDEVAALDRYEGVDRGFYVRVSVPVADPGASGPARVAVYVGDSERLDAPVDWPGTGSFADRVRAYCDGNDVRVTVDRT